MQLDDARSAGAFGMAAQERTWPVAVAGRGSHAEGYPPISLATSCRMDGGYTLHAKGLCIYALRSPTHGEISRNRRTKSFTPESSLGTGSLSCRSNPSATVRTEALAHIHRLVPWTYLTLIPGS